VTAEIPLLRESSVFAKRLYFAAERFGESRYFHNRRVNWSYRYCSAFYANEAACFASDPKAYLDGSAATDSVLSDVFEMRVNYRQVMMTVVKVIVHWSFRCLGKLMASRVTAQGITTYRKGYVDDIELVFDPDESAIIRGIYPFPIRITRQIRYLRYLSKKGYLFRLDGNAYALCDLVRFICDRRIASLMRLETRSEIRQALALTRLGFKTFQLSDEFNLGSLDFVRLLRRKNLIVINNAHGVGKYFPIHCYSTFNFLTHRQFEFYKAERSCLHSFIGLNDRSPSKPNDDTDVVSATFNIILLSQIFDPEIDDIITQCEQDVVDTIRQSFANDPSITLIYKPHPNRKNPAKISSFFVTNDISPYNSTKTTIFLSFFSTCHIDPIFKGRKYLIRTRLIHPEIAFDNDDQILDFSNLEISLRGMMI
jgi:hypothetical protein